jgi:Holliday junction DNA helicase RuvB
VEGNGVIDEETSNTGLQMLGVDELGLDTMDKRLVHTIITKYDGGPVGIDTLSVSLGEDNQTIEDIYEPYLIQIGFLKRTSRGRMATKHAYNHLGIEYMKSVEGELFQDSE